MNKKFLFLFAFLFLFSFAFVSAEKIVQTSNPTIGLTIEYQKLDYVQIGKDFQLNIHVYNSTTGLKVDNSTTNCSVHGYSKNGSHVIEEQLLYNPDDLDFYLDIPGELFTGGSATVIMDCLDGEGGFVSVPLEINLSGLPYHIETLIAYMFLVLFLLWLIILLSKKKEMTNEESLQNKLFQKYQEKNHIKLAFGIIYANMIKNIYIFQYLLGFLIIICIKEITYLFNLLSMYNIFVLLMSLYGFGAILVSAVMFSNIEEWIMEWKKQIENLKWGYEK